MKANQADPIPPTGDLPVVRRWGRAYGNISRKAFYMYASPACTSATRVTVTNASKLPVHAYERAC